MATIASLYVNLTASTASFTTQMEKAGKFLSRWGKSALNVATMLAKVGAAAGAAALGGLALLTKSAADSIDRIGKLADRLGIATEVYVAYEHAANLAGVGNEEFGKSLERMSRTIGEAALNGGTVADALERVGLSAQALANMGTQQQFEAIADAIKSIENPAERALLAFTLFGRQGQQLINLLATGSDGLKASIAEAERLGITFSRLDAAKVEEANDNITRMQTLFKGLGTQIAVQIAPVISGITARMLQFATTGDSMRERVGGALRIIAKGVGIVLETGRVLAMVYNGVRGVIAGAMGVAAQGLFDLLTIVNKVTGKFEEQVAFLEGFRDGLRDVSETSFDNVLDLASGFGDSAEKIEDFLDDVERSATAAAQPVLDLNTAFEDMGVTFEELDEQAKVLEDMQRQAERLFEETRTPMEKFEAEQAQINRLFEEGLIDVETYERALAKLREEQEAMTAAKVEEAAVDSGSDRESTFRVVDRALLDFDRRMNDPNRSIIPKLDMSNVYLASIDSSLKALGAQGVA